jgi:hypothetical protein
MSKGRCRIVVGHKNFIVESDWKEYKEGDLDKINPTIGEACLGEICLAIHVNGNLKFFGKRLLKECIVTLEVDKYGDK